MKKREDEIWRYKVKGKMTSCRGRSDSKPTLKRTGTYDLGLSINFCVVRQKPHLYFVFSVNECPIVCHGPTTMSHNISRNRQSTS